MFTHQQTLDAINAGLKALHRPTLDGIPIAAPGHANECVIGCSYKEFGVNLTDYGASGTADIYFQTEGVASIVAAAWADAGVEVVTSTDNIIRFAGGFAEWMRAFDGGQWVQLVIAGEDYDDYNLDWPEDAGDPGDAVVPVDQLPAV